MPSSFLAKFHRDKSHQSSSHNNVQSGASHPQQQQQQQQQQRSPVLGSGAGTETSSTPGTSSDSHRVGGLADHPPHPQTSSAAAASVTSSLNPTIHPQDSGNYRSTSAETSSSMNSQLSVPPVGGATSPAYASHLYPRPDQPYAQQQQMHPQTNLQPPAAPNTQNFYHPQPQKVSVRDMSVDMDGMNVGKLSLDSGGQGSSLGAVHHQGTPDSSHVPERPISAEEVRMKERVLEAQKQASLVMVSCSSCVGLTKKLNTHPRRHKHSRRWNSRHNKRDWQTSTPWQLKLRSNRFQRLQEVHPYRGYRVTRRRHERLRGGMLWRTFRLRERESRGVANGARKNECTGV